MLADLLRRLSGPPRNDLLDAHDARVAMAALMVRISRTDGAYTWAEQARIDAMLAARYGFDQPTSAAIRREAEQAEAAAQDTVQFTRLIKDAVPYEDRIGVVEALWRIAVTDGINADEQSFMRLTANLLGVSDQDSGLARQRVLREAQ